MSQDADPRIEAEEAMRNAVAATCPVDRLKWLRVALAWQDLAQAQAQCARQRGASAA